MKFKYQINCDQWDSPPCDCDYHANQKLKMFVGWIETISMILGWGELTVTSYWRESDSDSYHSILQAVDIRSKDKPQLFKALMGILGTILKQYDSTLQIFTHRELWGKKHEHIHVAIKDGKLAA